MGKWYAAGPEPLAGLTILHIRPGDGSLGSPAFGERSQLLVAAPERDPTWLAVVFEVSTERGDGEEHVARGRYRGQLDASKDMQDLDHGRGQRRGRQRARIDPGQRSHPQQPPSDR